MNRLSINFTGQKDRLGMKNRANPIIKNEGASVSFPKKGLIVRRTEIGESPPEGVKRPDLTTSRKTS